MNKEEFFKKAAEDVRMIIMDNDGVLNDGYIQITETGHRVKTFYIRDGFAIRKAKEKGIHVDILTYRVTEIMKKFSERWGVEGVHGLGNDAKEKILEETAMRLSIADKNILYIGDDIDDIPCAKITGLSACPSNASPQLKEICDYVSEFEGGRGAIRDIIENLLRARNDWL